jgi:hypothetical protein
VEAIQPAAITAATLLAGRALDALGGRARESTWAGMDRLAAVVRRKVSGHREGEAALAAVEHHPDDPGRVQALAAALTSLAADEPAFQAELTELVAQAKRDPSIGAFTTHVEGLATIGSIVNLAQVRDVHFHLATPTPPAASSQPISVAPALEAEPPGSDTAAERDLKPQDARAGLPTVEDDLRALEELKALLHEAVYVKFQERILFRRFPHLES